jgi:hypothetical protein
MKVTPSLVTNPAFDPRVYNVSFLTTSAKGKGLTRGRILQATGAVGAAGGKRYGCNFLYNPSAVQAQHGVDTNIVPSTNPNDASGPLIVPLQQTVNFSLLFDRTYETWDSSYNNKPAGQLGVYADVLALYNIVGITLSHDLSAITTAGTGGDVGKQSGSPQLMAVSPMVYTPVWVYFGGPLVYYGIIQSLGITYSHWTQNMIPSRCAADITVTLLPKPEDTMQSRLDGIKDFNNLIGIGDNPVGMADIKRAENLSFGYTGPATGSAYKFATPARATGSAFKNNGSSGPLVNGYGGR